jgi:Retrotransposon gag protein
MANAAAAALAGALGNHETKRRATELPLFYGRPEKESCTAQLLIDRFETAAAIAEWNTDVRKCQQFYLILRDRALEWWKSLSRIPDFNREDWTAVKRDFLRAYAPKYTARSACANLQELYQKSTETVQDFYLRCLASYDKIEEIQAPAMATARVQIVDLTQANANIVKKEGMDDMLRFVMQQLFIAGLKEDIRLKTMEANPVGLQETLAVAQQMEVIVGDKKYKSQITSVNQSEYYTEDEDEEEEEELSPEEQIALEKVNAVFKRNGRNFGKFAKNKKFGNFFKKSNPNVVCHGCGQKGHIIKNCYSKKKISKSNAIKEEDSDDDTEGPDDDYEGRDLQDYYGVAAIQYLNY